MQFNEVTTNKAVQITTVGIVSAAIGGLVGFLIGKKFGPKRIILPPNPPKETQLTLFDPDLEKLLADEEEIQRDWERNQEARRQANQLNAAVAIETNYDEERLINVFTLGDESDWDFAVEIPLRDPKGPYVIHQEEYLAGEMDFNQVTITYYSVDDIMCDTDDTPIYDYQGLMGELKFGHGSKDKDVVYIRNEVLHMEWEVILCHESYSEEILGIQFEKQDENDLKHSVHKFRQE